MSGDPERELGELRAALDHLDAELLQLAARRLEHVRRIGELKRGATNALFNRERERDVHARAERVAAEIGLDGATARKLVQTLVDAAHELQEAMHAPGGAGTASEAEVQRILIVGGAGRMGRLFDRAFSARGHIVDAYDVDDSRVLEAVAGDADVVIVSVPMDRATAMVERLGPIVRPDALLCDFNSLKSEICDALGRTCGGEAVGLHPMFGPSVRSLRRQKVVVCPVRSGPRAAWLRSELGRMGLELIETEPSTHDRMMAVVQVLVHFRTLVMGDALRRVGVGIDESLRFTSPIYRLELAFCGRLFAQDPNLYAEIEMQNPFGAEVRQAFVDSAAALRDLADRGDRDAFCRSFEATATYFDHFGPEAMKLSDLIIEALVSQA